MYPTTLPLKEVTDLVTWLRGKSTQPKNDTIHSAYVVEGYVLGLTFPLAGAAVKALPDWLWKLVWSIIQRLIGIAGPTISADEDAKSADDLEAWAKAA